MLRFLKNLKLYSKLPPEQYIKYSSEPIPNVGGVAAFFWGTFFEKKTLAPPKQMSFLTISNEIIFFKVQDTRLGAIVALNKGLE